MSLSVTPILELKYCERCGGLWFRPQGGEEVYCGKCLAVINELPAVQKRARGEEAGAITDVIPGGIEGSGAALAGGLA